MNTTTPPTGNQNPNPTPRPINPTPRVRFQAMSDRTISAHRNMVSSEQFDLSCDHAMLELVRQLVDKSGDGNQYYAMAAFLRIQGAHEFLSMMKSLAEKPHLVSAPKSVDNLDHRV